MDLAQRHGRRHRGRRRRGSAGPHRRAGPGAFLARRRGAAWPDRRHDHDRRARRCRIHRPRQFPADRRSERRADRTLVGQDRQSPCQRSGFPVGARDKRRREDFPARRCRVRAHRVGQRIRSHRRALRERRPGCAWNARVGRIAVASQARRGTARADGRHPGDDDRPRQLPARTAAARKTAARPRGDARGTGHRARGTRAQGHLSGSGDAAPDAVGGHAPGRRRSRHHGRPHHPPAIERRDTRMATQCHVHVRQAAALHEKPGGFPDRGHRAKRIPRAAYSPRFSVR